MDTCIHKNHCIFFNGPLATSKNMIQQYCNNHYADCARFMTLQHIPKDKIPVDLLPSQKIRAAQLISNI